MTRNAPKPETRPIIRRSDLGPAVGSSSISSEAARRQDRQTVWVEVRLYMVVDTFTPKLEWIGFIFIYLFHTQQSRLVENSTRSHWSSLTYSVVRELKRKPEACSAWAPHLVMFLVLVVPGQSCQDLTGSGQRRPRINAAPMMRRLFE